MLIVPHFTKNIRFVVYLCLLRVLDATELGISFTNFYQVYKKFTQISCVQWFRQREVAGSSIGSFIYFVVVCESI